MSTADNFNNGLKRLKPGIAPGAPGADTSKQIVDKLNYNLDRLLVHEGSFLGPGLAWYQGLLQISNPQGQILIGSENFQLDDTELYTHNGLFSIKKISVSKIEGTFSPARIGLPNGSLLIGGTANEGREIPYNTDHFNVIGDTFNIRAVPIASVTGNLASSKLTLGDRKIPVGRLNGTNVSTEEITLGSEFSITNSELHVQLATSVNAGNITTEANFLGTDPRVLTRSTDTAGVEKLSWVDNTSALSALVETRLKDSLSKDTIFVNPITGNDGVDNPGTSKYSPFKTLARALIQVVRNSYRLGVGSTGIDAFESAKIEMAPGAYIIDNREGEAGIFSTTRTTIDSIVAAGELYKFNPPRGGVILPRGISLEGSDLRKTSLIPLYVPASPAPRTAILRLTGGALISGLNFKDNPSQLRSHHLVDCFQFASLADLNLYYTKVFNAFKVIDGFSDVGGANLEPVLSESQIVGQVDSSSAVDANGYPTANAVSSASPYIYNVSVRSRFGLCGALIDGAEVTGLKSIVAAQFTNVSLQVDPTIYVLDSSDVLEGKNYREQDRHYAFKITNNAYAQVVSCFAIGSAIHYWTDKGGEISITNSCSNFGGISLYSNSRSATALPQDINFSGIRLLPPVIIENNVNQYVVATLDTSRITATEIGLKQILDVDPIKFIPNSYVYLSVPNPTSANAELKLQAKLVDNAPTFLKELPTTSKFNVVAGATAADENSIFAYMECTGIYEFQSTWFDPLFPPAGGLPAALIAEKLSRKQILLGSNIYVERIVEKRTEEERNYHLIISAPPNTRPPIINYLILQAQLQAAGHEYYISRVREVLPAELVGDAACCTISGKVFQISLLRGNRPEETSLPLGTPDLIEDTVIHQDYLNTISNLDPRLHDAQSLLNLSYDPLGVSSKTIRRFLTDLGAPTPQINQAMTPTARDLFIHRYVLLPNIPGIIVNSSFGFELARPSLIRCSGHTWEWVGYRNYTSALPKLQTKLLSDAVRLTAIQTALNGGRIYATGMDELGNLYQGRNVISLSTGAQTQVSFDGLQQASTGASSTVRNFTDVNISGQLQASSAKINRLTVSNLIFRPGSQFKVDDGATIEDLTDANIPNGIKANNPIGLQPARYGLVRKASAAELAAYGGNGYVTPVDMGDLLKMGHWPATDARWIIYPGGLKQFFGKVALTGNSGTITWNDVLLFPGFTALPHVTISHFGASLPWINIYANTPDSLYWFGELFGGGGFNGTLQFTLTGV